VPAAVSVAPSRSPSGADQVRVMVDRVLGRFGRLDILVNNAGVMTRGPLTTTSLINVAGSLPASSARDQQLPVPPGKWKTSPTAFPPPRATTLGQVLQPNGGWVMA
jgi:hypothetical protein